jgi:hypothetical protein
MSGIPPMSREIAAVYARQEMTVYAFIPRVDGGRC